MAGKAKILLIDDDPDLVRATSSVLESKGYQVVAAEDGDVGLEKAAAERPDLILLDVIMPRMDGFEFLRRIRLRSQHLPVVMLTTRASSTDRKRATELGADAYLVKSEFDEGALVDVVKRYLTRGGA